MFSKLFKKKTEDKPKTPEVMGLYLGGSFELDNLKMSLLEPSLVIEKSARSQLIQAVGEAPLDTGGTLLRFYTDDDGFLQVVLDGGMTETILPMSNSGTFTKLKPLALSRNGIPA